ncbi:3 beta-hydroxysteroid dehydrogenase/Delta 5--_4-isomerase [Paenibacillus konkukensis]|uniref:3 beta-hydroxysteroid dehydrogenase/Delta 5-->4-isomerase n=1 Tax=Paenibacillus konkukensis TaxID=2020716 RepID=A0ABY4RV43_9BACL|nr:3 beta-hydroxysteroid dehydrogenase/Delta 5-->4-isomerase [Paenibacillus konkukensis]
MKVLVTGATGFLGKHLAVALHKLGHEVTAAGRNAQAGAELAAQGIAFLPCRLEDTAQTVRSCFGQDIVFHCGALSSLWGSYNDFYESNVTGTRNVIKGCTEGGVQRLIYVSTPSIYFDYTDRLSIAESARLPRRAANAYAETKRLAEQDIDAAFRLGLAVVTVRPRAIFGPGDRAIVPRLIEASRQGKLPLIRGGRAVLDLTYVDNAVQALLLCMTAPSSVLGRKYNVTNGEPQPFIEVLNYLFERLGEPLRSRKLPYRAAYALAGLLEAAAKLSGSGKEPLLTRYSVGLLGRSQTLDITAAREELGYRPQVTVKEGIDAYAAWYRRQHD